MIADDDLAALFSSPTGSTTISAFGKIIAWNRTTFANIIELAPNVRVHDVDLKAGTDALTWSPGDIVELRKFDGPGAGGFQSWWIDGRLIRPGSDNTARLIEFMRTNLVREIIDDLVEQLLTSPAGEVLAAGVLAKRIHVAQLDDTAVRSSLSYGDPDTGTAGPTKTDVEISESGKAVVMLFAQARSQHDNTGTVTEDGYMGVRVSGATSKDPADQQAVTLTNGGGAGGEVENVQTSPGRAILFDDLAPGTHTFHCEYRARSIGSQTWFDDRVMLIFAY